MQCNTRSITRLVCSSCWTPPIGTYTTKARCPGEGGLLRIHSHASSEKRPPQRRQAAPLPDWPHDMATDRVRNIENAPAHRQRKSQPNAPAGHMQYFAESSTHHARLTDEKHKMSLKTSGWHSAPAPHTLPLRLHIHGPSSPTEDESHAASLASLANLQFLHHAASLLKAFLVTRILGTLLALLDPCKEEEERGISLWIPSPLLCGPGFTLRGEVSSTEKMLPIPDSVVATQPNLFCRRLSSFHTSRPADRSPCMQLQYSYLLTSLCHLPPVSLLRDLVVCCFPPLSRGSLSSLVIPSCSLSCGLGNLFRSSRHSAQN